MSRHGGGDRKLMGPTVEGDREAVVGVRDLVGEFCAQGEIRGERGAIMATIYRVYLHACDDIAAPVLVVVELNQRLDRESRVEVNLADDGSAGVLRNRHRRTHGVCTTRGPDSIGAIWIHFTQLRPAMGGIGGGDAIDSWVEEVHRAVAAGEEGRVRETTFQLGVLNGTLASGRADWQLQRTDRYVEVASLSRVRIDRTISC